MKKLFLLLTAVVVTLLSANAQTDSDLVVSAGELKSISLGDDMKVILVNTTDVEGKVKLSKAAMDKLHIGFSDGTMMVSSQKKLNETVYVVVNELAKITLGENTSITSDGILQGNIDLYVHFGATANLKTVGKLNAFPLGEIDVKIKRTPLQLTVSANID